VQYKLFLLQTKLDLNSGTDNYQNRFNSNSDCNFFPSKFKKRHLHIYN